MLLPWPCGGQRKLFASEGVSASGIGLVQEVGGLGGVLCFGGS